MKPKTTTQRKPWAEEFSEKVIKALEEGTAPWIKPWEAGDFVYPFNPVSGTKYRGANLVNLTLEQVASGREDPRFLTYKQAADKDW